MWLREYYQPIKKDEAIDLRIANFKEILKSNPLERNILNCLFISLTQIRDVEGAKKYGQIILNQSYGEMVDSNVYHNWGKLELTQKNYEEAITWYQKSLDSNSYNFEMVNYEMGGCYAILKNYEAAEECFLAAINHHKKNYTTTPKFWEALGLLYGEMNRFEDSLLIFKERLVNLPEDWYTLYCIGFCYQQLGDDLRALQYFYESLKYNPTCPETYNNLGVLAIELQGKIPEAVHHMEKALGLCEGKEYANLKGIICLNLFRLHRKIADYDKAEFYEAEYKKFLESLEEEGNEDELGMEG